YRTSDKSIGTSWYQIRGQMNKLSSDVRYWITYQTYPLDEIAARFHHRLVWIHPFPHGNGRWARVMADVLLMNMDQERFSWGAKSDTGKLGERSTARETYIRALRFADTKKYSELLECVRS